MTYSRRQFLKQSALVGGALSVLGPFHSLGFKQGLAAQPTPAAGYGPLVNKGPLWLPAEFNFQVISTQGQIMSDGNPTPGIFDGMAAYPGNQGTTILIRNHENREQAGEIKVLTPTELRYNPTANGGNTKLVVQRTENGRDPTTNQKLYNYEIVESFAILAGTSTNCAGGIRSPHTWITCEEVVKRLNGIKHGYIFEIDAMANGPVEARAVPQAGRRAHEAALECAGIIYMTEDRGLSSDTLLGTIGSCFYRYIPSPRGVGALADTTGPLQALKLRDEFHANMDQGRTVGVFYKVEWVTVDQPDHDDDTDDRRDRLPGLTPNRIAAQDKGAAYFDRLEGMWTEPGQARIYFVTTAGGAANLGQVWEYAPGPETLTLIYESTNSALLQAPDNVVVVPATHDIMLCEDGSGEQFVRGVTTEGAIYDFAKTTLNDSEFCGACFDPDGQTLYLNQQGDRGSLPNGPVNGNAVTYAIYGPFEKRNGKARTI
jgi:secreted PhoX family phosphatase